MAETILYIDFIPFYSPLQKFEKALNDSVAFAAGFRRQKAATYITVKMKHVTG